MFNKKETFFFNACLLTVESLENKKRREYANLHILKLEELETYLTITQNRLIRECFLFLFCLPPFNKLLYFYRYLYRLPFVPLKSQRWLKDIANENQPERKLFGSLCWHFHSHGSQHMVFSETGLREAYLQVYNIQKIGIEKHSCGREREDKHELCRAACSRASIIIPVVVCRLAALEGAVFCASVLGVGDLLYGKGVSLSLSLHQHQC